MALLDAPPPPPSRAGLVWGLLLGAFGGLGGGAVVFDLAGVIEARTTPQVCPDEPTLEARVAELEAQLEAAGRGAEVEESRGLAERGAPIPWTDDVPETHREAGLREIARTVGKEYAASLEGVDCGEYPCVLTFVAQDMSLTQEEAARWARRLDQALVGKDDRYARTSVPKGAGAVHTVAVPHRELDALERIRVKHRVREADRQAVGDQFVVEEGF
jgi:hypothetical protein